MNKAALQHRRVLNDLLWQQEILPRHEGKEAEKRINPSNPKPAIPPVAAATLHTLFQWEKSDLLSDWIN